MNVGDVIVAVDRLAPFALAEPWDHVGLQVGSPHDGLSNDAAASAGARPVVLVALEVSDAALEEAGRLGARAIVAHHPLIFDPLERLSDDTEAGRLALRAARQGVAVITAHTNLDKARGGIADVVAGLLGLEAVQPLQPAAADVLKLVGFVPEDDADLVRQALFAVGAGVIGEYEHCSWSVGGQGTFFGRHGTTPAAGVAGRDETVAELRMEVVFPRRLRRRVVAAYIAAHPYEEPAFDLVPVENEIASRGLGRLGVLPAPLSLAALADEVAAVLRLPSVRYAGDGAREVFRVAVLPGSGAEAIARGVAQVADVLVTGDVKYHEARAAQAQGLALIDAPHGWTEQEAMLRWAERLADALDQLPKAHTLLPLWHRLERRLIQASQIVDGGQQVHDRRMAVRIRHDLLLTVVALSHRARAICARIAARVPSMSKQAYWLACMTRVAMCMASASLRYPSSISAWRARTSPARAWAA